MMVGGQRHAPAALPPGKTRHPFYGRLGGPQGRSGWVQKISHPRPGFDLWTVHPLASRCTGCANPGHNSNTRTVGKYLGPIFLLVDVC